MMQKEQWQGFEGRLWKEEINVRDFIQNNYTPYEGDSSFLADPTEATNQLWGKLQELQKEERAKGGVLDMETEVVSSLTAYGPGYICEELKGKTTAGGYIQLLPGVHESDGFFIARLRRLKEEE